MRNWKKAGAMKVDVGIEVLAVKVVERLGPFSGDMTVAKMLTDDRTVLGFCQCVIVGVARA